jgi:hypothetical protein
MGTPRPGPVRVAGGERRVRQQWAADQDRGGVSERRPMVSNSSSRQRRPNAPPADSSPSGRSGSTFGAAINGTIGYPSDAHPSHHAYPPREILSLMGAVPDRKNRVLFASSSRRRPECEPPHIGRDAQPAKPFRRKHSDQQAEHAIRHRTDRPKPGCHFNAACCISRSSPTSGHLTASAKTSMPPTKGVRTATYGPPGPSCTGPDSCRRSPPECASASLLRLAAAPNIVQA